MEVGVTNSIVPYLPTTVEELPPGRSTFTCIICGHVFTILNSCVRKGRGRFCSRQCAGKNRYANETPHIFCGVPTYGLLGRLWARIRKDDAGWWWTGQIDAEGYGHVYTGGGIKDSRPHSLLVHRVVYEIFFGPIPDGLDVLHSCNHPRCCDPSHLKVGTHKINMGQAAEEGRMRRGESCNLAKLTEKSVQEIRSEYGKGISVRILAEKYSVSISTIFGAVHRKTWKHVQ